MRGQCSDALVLIKRRLRIFLYIWIITTTFLSVAYLNRLPVLFADTIAYSSAGEKVLGAFTGFILNSRSQLAAGGAQDYLDPRSQGEGTSEARSPYYGFVFASLDRIAGIWIVASTQCIIVAIALFLALRRLGVRGAMAVATVSAAIGSGVAFYSVVMLPDVFLGLAIIALAFLISTRDLPRGEYLFWVGALFCALIFHRSFLAVSLVMVVIVGIWGWRRTWFVRNGWTAAAGVTFAALFAHASVAPVVEHVYGGRIASPPFLLARMIEGTVVPDYLKDVCREQHYLLCEINNRLPMDHDTFLWDTGKDGVFQAMSLTQRQILAHEANPIVIRAIAARPIAASIEALRYTLREFFFVGMDDFAQRVPTRWPIAPSLSSAMALYPSSGIVVGDFELGRMSRIAQVVYNASLLVLTMAAIAIVFVRWKVMHRSLSDSDSRRLMAVTVIVMGLVSNAAVSGIFSGIRDRYTGRIAWLACIAASALLVQMRKHISPLWRGISNSSGR